MLLNVNLIIVFNEEAEAPNENICKLNVVDLEREKFRLLAANFFYRTVGRCARRQRVEKALKEDNRYPSQSHNRYLLLKSMS